jgi:hypothetical protein
MGSVGSSLNRNTGGTLLASSGLVAAPASGGGAHRASSAPGSVALGSGSTSVSFSEPCTVPPTYFLKPEASQWSETPDPCASFRQSPLATSTSTVVNPSGGSRGTPGKLHSYRPHPDAFLLGKLNLPTYRSDVFVSPLDTHQGLVTTASGQRLGSLHCHGTLYLDKGPKGVWDLFNNPFLQVHYQRLQDSHDELASSILEHAYDSALKQSLVPGIRREFPQLKGQGTEVVFLDFDPEHLQNLQSVLGSKPFGVAPEVKQTMVMFQKMPSHFQGARLEELPATLSEFKQAILGDITQDFQSVQTSLSAILNRPNPPSCVNISLTMERYLEYSNILYEIVPKYSEALQSASISDVANLEPALLAQLRDFEKGTGVERFNKVKHFIDPLLENSDSLNQCLQSYQALTKMAFERGIAVVVSAGNSNYHTATNIELDCKGLCNYLGQSPWVLVVGASDTNRTPQNFADDKLAAFSNPVAFPQERERPVALMAPGLLIPIDTQPTGRSGAATLLESPTKGFNNGTSLSAPFVAGLLCLMRQMNPQASVASLYRVLALSCENPEQLPYSLGGFGFLNPAKALAAIQPKPLVISGAYPAASAFSASSLAASGA